MTALSPFLSSVIRRAFSALAVLLDVDLELGGGTTAMARRPLSDRPGRACRRPYGPAWGRRVVASSLGTSLITSHPSPGTMRSDDDEGGGRGRCGRLFN